MENTSLETAAKEADKLASTYGIAKGVKPENVTRRVTELVKHGTEPLLARALAIEAENTQVAMDGQRAAARDDAETAARKSIGERVLKMTKAELVVFAEQNGIVIEPTVTKKEEVLAVVQAALATK